MPAICHDDIGDVERDLTRNPEGVVQLRRQSQTFVVMTQAHYEALQESMGIYNDEDLMEDIKRGVQQMQRGELTSWEEAQKELGW